MPVLTRGRAAEGRNHVSETMERELEVYTAITSVVQRWLKLTMIGDCRLILVDVEEIDVAIEEVCGSRASRSC